MVVVNSVSDHRGKSTFTYSGGRVELARFLGFAEVEGRYENGLHFEAQFSLAPYTRGDLVSRTERRADGTIERFAYNRYYSVAGQNVVIDWIAPYFNPTRRACDSRWEGHKWHPHWSEPWSRSSSACPKKTSSRSA